MTEDIKILETMLKIRKEQKEVIELANGYCENCDDDIRALENAIKALKERQQDKVKIQKQQEELNFYKKQELSYLAGYEDGKNHKVTAVQIKAEQQQAYIEKEREERDRQRIDYLKLELRKKDKIIDLMAKDKYKNISILEMAKIGQAISYDPTKMFNGISDEEAIAIIKQYFFKESRGQVV